MHAPKLHVKGKNKKQVCSSDILEHVIWQLHASASKEDNKFPVNTQLKLLAIKAIHANNEELLLFIISKCSTNI